MVNKIHKWLEAKAANYLTNRDYTIAHSSATVLSCGFTGIAFGYCMATETAPGLWEVISLNPRGQIIALNGSVVNPLARSA